eukprot:TRINITY_DN14767_c0_g1_i1.p1 TRINITY_DN14767_c0_g1~~TRINITY_DN14767_c0_g1_i1.p1  ORF type:complete len:413 (+),score=10.40 TRINITY_DN14767_c0_g1_i1:33-1241(+)
MYKRLVTPYLVLIWFSFLFTSSLSFRVKVRYVESPQLHHEESNSTFLHHNADANVEVWTLTIINGTIVGAIVFYLSHTYDMRVQTDGGQGDLWCPMLLTVLYMGLSIAHTFSAYEVARSPLHPIVPTICVYVFKLAIAIGMNMQTLRDSFVESMNTIWHHRGVVLAYIFPAACMCFSDLIDFVSLTTLSAAEYQVLLHCRLILIAPVWQCVLKRKLLLIQWGLIAVCFWAMLLKERSTLVTMSSSLGIPRLRFMFFRLILSTLGNVFIEKLLTSSPLSVTEQNIILYTQSLIMLSAFVVGLSFTQGLDLNAQSLHHIFDFSVAFCIFSLSTMGIVVSFLLKCVGNIAKELAGIAVTVIIVAIEALCLHKGNWHILDGQAVILITLSAFAFSFVHVQTAQSSK